jgi:hypothetical protein
MERIHKRLLRRNNDGMFCSSSIRLLTSERDHKNTKKCKFGNNLVFNIKNKIIIDK